MTEDRDAAVTADLQSWVAAELAYWRDHPISGAGWFGEFHRLNAANPTVFIITIEGGEVSAWPKPAGRGFAPGDPLGDAHMERLALYLHFLIEVVAEHDLDLSLTFAFNIGDLPVSYSTAPVFAFQKSRGSRFVLLPDVDFMQHNWYRSHFNGLPFDEKLSQAVFIGASTGQPVITTQDIIDAVPDRLRLAKYFHGSKDALIKIGLAVQIATPEAEAMLLSQPYFSRQMSWEDQLRYRFLLSMDGNGPTCSRLVNALRSDSILVKYRSDHVLYYFLGLKPWVHYVPMETEADLSQLLEEDRLGLFNAVSMRQAATAFFQDYLVEARVKQYAAMLLMAYEKIFARPPKRADRSRSVLSGVRAHLAYHGDVDTAPGGWIECAPGAWVEGVALFPERPTSAEIGSYRCGSGDSVGDFVPVGSFAGVAGRSQAVTQLEVRIAPEHRANHGFVGVAQFDDGAIVPIPRHEGICASGGAVMQGIRIDLVSDRSPSPQHKSVDKAGCNCFSARK